jgi:hypothetical protein
MRPTSEQTRERRMEVLRRKLRGQSHSAIARDIGVRRATVSEDAKWLETFSRERAADADSYQEVGHAMLFFEQIEGEALRQFYSLKSPVHKHKFLQTAVLAREKMVRLMMDAGVIKRAAVDVNLDVDYSKLTTGELLAKRREMLERLANFALPGAN